MTPELIMMGLKLAQQKGQQNQADSQRLANSMQAPQFSGLASLGNAQSLLGTNSEPQVNWVQQPQTAIGNNLFETEEQRKKRLGLF